MDRPDPVQSPGTASVQCGMESLPEEIKKRRQGNESLSPFYYAAVLPGEAEAGGQHGHIVLHGNKIPVDLVLTAFLPVEFVRVRAFDDDRQGFAVIAGVDQYGQRVFGKDLLYHAFDTE